MGGGQQISEFDRQMDVALEELKKRLPNDLIIARTSDQPRQVEEKIDLFMSSLYEAIALVIIVGLLGLAATVDFTVMLWRERSREPASSLNN